MVLPIVRVIVQANQNTMWFYCTREPNYTMGFAISCNASEHLTYWIGNSVDVKDLNSFLGGTSAINVSKFPASCRLLFKK